MSSLSWLGSKTVFVDWLNPMQTLICIDPLLVSLAGENLYMYYMNTMCYSWIFTSTSLCIQFSSSQHSYLVLKLMN